MEIIPAIDIIDGACVRLTKGDYGTKKVYNENPVEIAKSFEQAGIKRLHLVDLDGAKQRRVINLEVLKSISEHTSLAIDFGGGIQSDEDIEAVFAHGASQVTGGSIAVRNPELFAKWIEKYGAEKIILGADVKNEKIAIGGWEETTSIDLVSFLRKYTQEYGLKYVICTDVAKDGMLQGPSFDLYQRILDTLPNLKLIASGGIAEIKDMVKLKEMGVYGAITGKAIYEGRVTLEELSTI